MQEFFALLLLTELISFCGCDFQNLNTDVTLSRKRRYLQFPEGSVAVVRNFIKSQSYKWTYMRQSVKLATGQNVKGFLYWCDEYILRSFFVF